ncbi:MAG: hypothetical protein KF734_18735 [Saprospiraceae bacterium]|nr:hypothetical protein [Saprospiraceae bacterium]
MSHQKVFPVALSLLVLGAVLWPVRENWRRKPKDSFPLSYFPMFSHKRDSTYSVNYFIGYDADGQSLLVPYRYVGTGGFNQVRRQINKKVKQGKGASVIGKVARRLSKAEQPPYDGLVRVALVTGTYHLDSYFLHRQKTPLHEVVVAEKTIEKP